MVMGEISGTIITRLWTNVHEIVGKGGFWVPDFYGVGDTPHFGHNVFNRSHFRACGRFSLSSVQRAPRVTGEKRR